MLISSKPVINFIRILELENVQNLKAVDFMNELNINKEGITLFCLNAIAPKNIKNFIMKLMKKSEMHGVTSIDVVETLVDIYKLKNDWQKQVYSISDSEQARLLRQGWLRMLFPHQVVDFLSNYIMHEDSNYVIIPTDSSIQMLRDRIFTDVTLKGLYLFLLENKSLPLFLLIPKSIYYNMNP